MAVGRAADTALAPEHPAERRCVDGIETPRNARDGNLEQQRDHNHGCLGCAVDAVFGEVAGSLS